MMFAGQQHKPCEYCKNPLHFFCTSCNCRLCENCAVTHLLSITDKTHNVVNYRDRYSGKRATGLCEIHDDNERELVCTYCKEILCPKCVPRHTKFGCNVIKIQDFIWEKVKYINRQNDFLCNVIKPQLETMITEIRRNLLTLNIGILENEIGNLEKKWKGEIDKIVQELKRYGRFLCKKGRNECVKKMIPLEVLHLKTSKILQENSEKLCNPELLLSSSHPYTDGIGIYEMKISTNEEMSDLKKTIQKIDKHIEDAVKLKEKTVTHKPYIKELLTYKILGNTFHQTPFMTPVAISCRIADVILISSTNASSDNKLLKFNHNGELLATIPTEFKVKKMALMRNGDLLSLHRGVIFLVTSCFTSVWTKIDHKYTTTDITTSATDEVYACQQHSSLFEIRIVKWDIHGNKLQNTDDIIYPTSKNGYPSHIRINGNTDICVVVDDRPPILVVWYKTGLVHFVYRAKVTIDGLATNNLCHIFLNEGKQITELDEGGYLLRQIMYNYFIHCFDIDREDNMWIIHSEKSRPTKSIEKVTFTA